MPRELPPRVDLAVIGGGPAGSVAAALVRRQDPDKRVLVLEKDSFPRHHVGESLIAGIAPILARAGVLDALEAEAERGRGVVRKAGIVFHWGSGSAATWTADFRDGATGRPPLASYHVDRAVLDRLLLDHARALGAEVIEEATVEGFADAGDRIVLDVDHGGVRHHVEAAHVIDASGLARVVSRARGEARIGFDDMSNFAVHGYWRGSAKKEHGARLPDGTFWTFIATTTSGWCWHIPLSDEIVSVGLVTSRDAIPHGGPEALEAFYVENVRAAGALGELLRDARLEPHPLAPQGRRVLVQRDWSSYAERLSGPRHLLVGDAALFVDPILTSGVVLSIVGASLAAGVLHTQWNEPQVDAALLRASFEETYLDLALGYHRVAQIWYRRNDKVRSWWWQAKRAALRASETSTADDARAFLAMTLGLVRDPFAARMGAGGDGLDVIRPDKLALARGVLGDTSADGVDRALFDRLADITTRHADENEARTAVHSHLLDRWRARLDRPLRLDHLEVRARTRHYSDRTLAGWPLTTLTEIRRRDTPMDLLARVVLPAGSDACSPLGIALDRDSTLRASIVASVAHLPLGSHQERRAVERVWERLVQLDVAQLLDPVELDEAPRDTHLDTVLTFARALAYTPSAASSPPLGLAIDRLGRSFDVITPGMRLVVVPFTGEPPRAFACTSRLAISHVGATLEDSRRSSLLERIERVRAIEARGAIDWDTTLRAIAGGTYLVDERAARASTYDRVRAVEGGS
ncbi:MAG: tryptophan 7-halogenase [Deltaproteobacteria bacterium]|nr:tryptophan 7-halogenase [Deltaproteobacteria bacterium]